jgi:ubiquinol-cytochrome c reductase cytochrome b subunit
MISQIAALYYFAHFLIILPIVSSIERPDPLPFSITEAVLGKDHDGVLAPAAVPIEKSDAAQPDVGRPAAS